MIKFFKNLLKINSIDRLYLNRSILQKKYVSNFKGSHRPDNDYENFIWFIGGFACGYLINERR
jgi:hypothetical protein